VIGLELLLMTGLALAAPEIPQESVPQSPAAAPAAEAEAEPAREFDSGDTEAEVKPSAKRVIIRRKDQGTKARERFKTEIIPKSRYRLEGRPLSVDPD
jgi:hypothetical protein